MSPVKLKPPGIRSRKRTCLSWYIFSLPYLSSPPPSLFLLIHCSQQQVFIFPILLALLSSSLTSPSLSVYFFSPLFLSPLLSLFHSCSPSLSLLFSIPLLPPSLSPSHLALFSFPSLSLSLLLSSFISPPFFSPSLSHM